MYRADLVIRALLREEAVPCDSSSRSLIVVEKSIDPYIDLRIA